MENQGAQLISSKNHATVPVTCLSDPRIAPFVDLTQLEKRESPTHFIAEGEKVTIRLLASHYRCEKVLCAEHKVANIVPLLQPGTELLIATRGLVQEIAGFKFHSGVIGLGARLISSPASTKTNWGSGPILVLPQITDPANLGALVRVAAAFGVSSIVLGEHCRDPFSRQTVRTSMGTLFCMRLIQSRDLENDLRAMQNAGLTLLATVLDPDAQPLRPFTAPAAFALLVGNEGPGLPESIIRICDHRLTIPMKLGTDSLNVVVAAGIFMHHLTADRE